MIQASRDAGHAYQGHQDRPLDYLDRDWLLASRHYSVAATWSEDLRCCRGDPDRSVHGAGIAGQSASSDVTPGSRAPGRDAMEKSIQNTGWMLATPLRHASQRSKDDSLAARAHRTTTLGDSGRQDLGLTKWPWVMFSAMRRLLGFQFDLSKCEIWKRLMTIVSAGDAIVIHLRALMGSRVPGGKGSVNTTKNDNTQNWHFSSHFRLGSPLRFERARRPGGRGPLEIQTTHIGDRSLFDQLAEMQACSSLVQGFRSAASSQRKWWLCARMNDCDQINRWAFFRRAVSCGGQLN